MAQDIGLLLRGLGAAFDRRVPQFRQELAQEQEAQYLQQQRQRQEQLFQNQQLEFQQAQQDRQKQQQEALIKSTFQDSQAGLIALQRGDLDAVLTIAEEGAQAAIDAGIDPSGYMRILESAQLARAGNPRGWNDLRMGLLQSVQIGTAKGYITPPEESEYTLKPGERRMRGGREIASIPADERGYRMLSAQEAAQMGLEPGNYQVNEKTGQVSRIGAPSTVVNVGQATESERTAGILANRLDFAQTQIKDILASAPEAEKPAAGATALNTLGLGYLARVANPTERQIIEAAQLDMLDAALTLGTGAAYTREQLEGYRESYFPQLGDDQATIEAKAQRLNNLVDAAYTKAGRAAPSARGGFVDWNDLKD